jgi:predicted ATPase
VIAAAQHRGSAEPWREASFIDAVADLQKQRQLRASLHPEDIQFHDRSVVCTAALAVYLGYSISPFLAEELDRINDEAIFETRVFFVRNLGFITPTAARRISFEESLRFERIHEETYQRYGFELIEVEAASVVERVSFIKDAIGL